MMNIKEQNILFLKVFTSIYRCCMLLKVFNTERIGCSSSGFLIVILAAFRSSCFLTALISLMMMLAVGPFFLTSRGSLLAMEVQAFEVAWPAELVVVLVGILVLPIGDQHGGVAGFVILVWNTENPIWSTKQCSAVGVKKCVWRSGGEKH